MIDSCVCGAEVSAPTMEGLVEALQLHTDEVHPEFGVGPVQLRNYLEAAERLAPPGVRLAAIGAVEVHRVTVDRIDDFLGFFDTDAFADNRGWASCYCMYHHLGGEAEMGAWATRTWQQNRAEMENRLRTGSTTGYLAYVDGRPVAWCNASPRSEFPEHRTGDGDDRVMSLSCFVVSAAYRRHGVGSMLLQEACRQAAEAGMSHAEGYPAESAEGDAGAYRGTVPMFQAAGFEVVSGQPPVVRREL